MGGPVAQLLWRRHPELVAGLVLCATVVPLRHGARERFIFSSMMATAVGTTRAGDLVSRVPPASMRRLGPGGRRARARPRLRAWAAGEMRRHDVVKIMEAGQAIGSYNARRWIGEVDVPTTVMVTDARPGHRAGRAAQAGRRRSPAPRSSCIDDGHIACAKREFGPALVRAVDSVVARIPRAARRRAAAR